MQDGGGGGGGGGRLIVGDDKVNCKEGGWRLRRGRGSWEEEEAD